MGLSTLRHALGALAVAAALAGCGSSDQPGSALATSSAAAGGTVTPIPTPPGTETPTPAPATPTPAPSSAPPPTPTPAVTAAQVLAVAQASFPKGPNGYVECVKPGQNGAADWSQCPFTPRLMARMAQNPTSGPGGGADPLCRCQNVSLDYSATADVAPTGGVAHVVLFSGNDKLDLIEILYSGQLLVDDTQCTGKGPSTSIYVPNPPPCG